jgi:integrase/recombinase XerD
VVFTIQINLGHKEVPVTHLRKIMLEELQRRHYSEGTTRYYIRHVERFARHFNCSPDRLGPQHIRQYQAHLFSKRKLSPGSVTNHLCALRFFYIQTLKKPWSIADTPYPKKTHRLPTILSQEEVAQVIDAARSPFHRTILMTLYATDVRNAELTRLKVSDIDSGRMVIHIQGGKGREDRDVMLSPVLLEELRAHWRRLSKKSIWLFPGNSCIVVISPSILKRRATPASTPLAVRGSRRRCIPTYSATASPRTCWKRAPTCTPFRCCWAITT